MFPLETRLQLNMSTCLVEVTKGKYKPLDPAAGGQVYGRRIAVHFLLVQPQVTKLVPKIGHSRVDKLSNTVSDKTYHAIVY